MFLWWSKDWEANSPRKGEPHTRAPPGGTTPGSTRSHHLTPTSSSVRRTQIAPRGSAGPGIAVRTLQNHVGLLYVHYGRPRNSALS